MDFEEGICDNGYKCCYTENNHCFLEVNHQKCEVKCYDLAKIEISYDVIDDYAIATDKEKIIRYLSGGCDDSNITCQLELLENFPVGYSYKSTYNISNPYQIQPYIDYSLVSIIPVSVFLSVMASICFCTTIVISYRMVEDDGFYSD